MTEHMDLIDSLSEFESRLLAHVPSSEAGLREVLAQSIRETLELAPGDVEVEAAYGIRRHDVLVHQSKTGVEVKFHRAIASGMNRPLTMQYGQLLADVRKLLANHALASRILVLVTDRSGETHLRNKALLPVAWDRKREIRSAQISGLAKSASRPATADGPWIDGSTRLVWKSQRLGTDAVGFAWHIEPVE
jgi:hypothetical protein